MSIVFASGNRHKLEEIRQKLPDHLDIISMRDLGFDGDIEEPGETLEENARIKAAFIHDRYRVDCFADDTGLEVEALDGAPGVYSARYAGEGCSFADNVQKLLREMTGKSNRKARFRTVIHLILEGKEYVFDGVVNGSITSEAHGTDGFGYDPVFMPDGYDRTFAEMSLEEKNRISHRALAVEKLSSFLHSL